eukprot:764483-Hanusia_phi.AAC.4
MTELAGPSAVGKTQFCLSVTSRVTWCNLLVIAVLGAISSNTFLQRSPSECTIHGQWKFVLAVEVAGNNARTRLHEGRIIDGATKNTQILSIECPRLNERGTLISGGQYYQRWKSR